MYTLVFEPGAYRIFKKFTKNLQQEFIVRADELMANPLAGEPLQGSHRIYRSLHFSYQGVAYRIIYQFFPEQKQVAIQLADKRENIYKRLQEMKL
jgi:mRNA-degrading endonuclease RelE of RelBE toxin-antitoxin system